MAGCIAGIRYRKWQFHCIWWQSVIFFNGSNLKLDIIRTEDTNNPLNVSVIAPTLEHFREKFSRYLLIYLLRDSWSSSGSYSTNNGTHSIVRFSWINIIGIDMGMQYHEYFSVTLLAALKQYYLNSSTITEKLVLLDLIKTPKICTKK